MSLSHELTPPPLSSPAAAPPNPSEATEAKSESHREQEHANASKMDHSNAAPMTKLQQVQVQDSDQGTATHEDGDSTSDDEDTGLYDDGDAASDLTSSGTLGRSVRDFDDDACGDSCCCCNLLYACPAHRPHGFDSANNSNDSRFVHDPGGTSFRRTLDAATTSDHGNHAFDLGGVPFHSNLPSSRVPHSIVSHNLVFDPGGDSVNSYIDGTSFSDVNVACFLPCMIQGVEQAPPSECALAAFVHSDIASPLSVDNPSTIQIPRLSLLAASKSTHSRHRYHCKRAETSKSEFDPGGSKFEPPRRCKESIRCGLGTAPSFSFVQQSPFSGHVGLFVLAARVLSPAGAHSSSRHLTYSLDPRTLVIGLSSH
jgi:hypothetical protein